MPIKINGSTSGYTEIKAPDTAPNNTLTLPSTSGTLMTTGGSNTFTANQVIEVTDNSNAALRITQLGTGDAIRVEDSTNPDSSPFVVDASGNVGIGTASPAYKVTASAGGGDAASLHISGTTSYLALGSYLAGTNGAARVAYDRSTGSILFSNGLSDSSQTERMRIDGSGRVLVGTNSSFISVSNLQVASSVGNQIAIRDTGTAAGRCWRWSMDAASTVYIINDASNGVYIGYGGTSWSGLSDERAKDIIEPISDAASKVSTLRAVIGKYKTDEEGKRRSFLIAQDVQAVLPEAISVADQETGYLGLSYTDTIPLLTAALQEALTKIDALETRIATLENA